MVDVTELMHYLSRKIVIDGVYCNNYNSECWFVFNYECRLFDIPIKWDMGYLRCGECLDIIGGGDEMSKLRYT